MEQDFHKYCNNTNDKYAIIVGNPPYIRYQYFNKEQQLEAEKIFNRNNIKYSKLMNSWCAFVVGCTNLLKENWKLGFVLPAELLQVSHAKLIREFLIKNYEKISIVSFKKLVFAAIQQDVVLLLCQKGNGIPHIEYIESEDDKTLKNIDLYKLKNPIKNIHNSSKWTNYFLEQKELDFLDEIKNRKDLFKVKDFCFVELEGRSFGGGALELMPSEIANIIIPYIKTAENLFEEIESVVKNKGDISELLKYTNKFLLEDNFGFTTQELNLITNIHEKLLNKRLFRKRN